MAMSRQSRPANRGLVCLLPEGGWFMRSWTAACVNDGCRCRGDGGMLRRFSAKLWRCAALFILDEEGERCGGGDWWEPADKALGTFIACPRAVTSASPASLGSALEDASILASGQHGVAAAIAGSCLSRIPGRERRGGVFHDCAEALRAALREYMCGQALEEWRRTRGEKLDNGDANPPGRTGDVEVGFCSAMRLKSKQSWGCLVTRCMRLRCEAGYLLHALG